MIDVDYPIIGAPMFLVSYEELVIAVAEAGGLGAIALPSFRTADDLKFTLNKVREKTDKPIGCSIHVSGKFEWKEKLALCLDAGVKLFISSLGDPRRILSDVHANGGKVFADVISLEQGLRARDRGVDGLVAVASGGGGHAGNTPAIILVPYLKKKTGLPVVAAGGISTGAQMAAAMAIGACAVITGTRLIATNESRAKDAYKRAVVSSGPDDIVYTERISGTPANWLLDSVKEIDKTPDLKSKIWLDLWSAGQSVAQTDEIKPAGDVILEMVEEYITICKELGQGVTDLEIEI